MPVWLWWLQQFQGTLVGLVGFAGVIQTLAMNDLLARRRREPARHGALLRTMCQTMLPELDAAITAMIREERGGARAAA